MCGRAAQTRHAVTVAASSFGVSASALPSDDDGAGTYGGAGESDNSGDNVQHQNQGTTTAQQAKVTVAASPMRYPWNDNFNMSPGMDTVIFFKDNQTDSIRAERFVWGLVNKKGSPKNPLPLGMGKHFEGLMYNARADTLFQKPSFGRLASMGKSCVVALDGFFEWKAPGASGKGKKQPYFVRRAPPTTSAKKNDDNPKPYLLMAGLWNRVESGWDESPELCTFALLTTDVCQPLSWLHTRMPVCIWDDALAQQWLEKPTEKVLDLLDEGARNTPKGKFDWHEVTMDMSTTKFRSADAIKPLPKVKSLKHYFTAASSASKVKPKPIANRKSNQEEASPRSSRKTLEMKRTTSDEPTPSASSKRATEESPKPPLPNPYMNAKSPATKRKTGEHSSPAVRKRNKTEPSPKKTTTPMKRGTIDTFFKPKTR